MRFGLELAPTFESSNRRSGVGAEFQLNVKEND